MLESVYEAVLARELEERGLQVDRQASDSFHFRGMRFDEGLRVDLVVLRVSIIEFKSVEAHASVHLKQVLTCLCLLQLSLGLLIHFGAGTFRERADVSSTIIAYS